MCTWNSLAKRDGRHALLVAVALSAMAMQPAWGGTDPSRRRPQPAAQEPRAAEVPVRPAAGYKLRCWQYGRLLFEEPVSEPPILPGSQGVTLSSGEPGRGSISLFDTRDGLCLVKQGEPGHPAPRGEQ